MTIFWFLSAMAFAALAFGCYVRTRFILKRLDQMLTDAVNGEFTEIDYTETLLSRLESRMYQYLSLQKQHRDKISKERDTVKMLISDISHQTKTPIANILLYTQLLQENIGSDSQAACLAQQIEQQSEKLHFLIQALLKTSRLEHGIVAVVPEKYPLRELVRQLHWPAQAQEKKIHCQIQEDIPDVTAYFDLKWTLEALSNLIDNAVKYTPYGGSVSLTFEDYTMFVRINVADTGIGISEENTAQIFARFYRAGQVQQEPGVGLGLCLTREILQREGGYIKVSSRLGKGSVFSVFLPKNCQNCKN